MTKIGPILPPLVDLTAGWLADEIRVDSKFLQVVNCLDFYFVCIGAHKIRLAFFHINKYRVLTIKYYRT